MFRNKISKLLIDYGVKQEAIIETISSNRVTFTKKMKDNSFSDDEKNQIYRKYGGLL